MLDIILCVTGKFLLQLKKIGDSVPSVSSATFDQAWHTVLSEVTFFFCMDQYLHVVVMTVT